MEKEDIFDVIILGAGPAGLSVGSELSSKLNVLIVEKGLAGQTIHAWTYWNDRVKEVGISDTVTSRMTNGVARSMLGSEVRIKLGKINKFIPAIDENKLLNKFIVKIKKNKAKILSNCSFESLRDDGNRIHVNTSLGQFTWRLLIDAMGYDSVLASRFRVVTRGYFIPVGGWAISRIGLPSKEYNFMESILDKHPIPYWWSFPVDKKTDFIGSFYVTRTPLGRDLLEKDFAEMVKAHPYTQGKKITIKKKYYGNIPIASNFDQNNVDRIAFIGDARAWGTGFGWGFSPIISNYRDVSRRILKCLAANELDANSLKDATEIKFNSPLTDLNAKLEELVGVFLVNCNLKDFDRVLKVFKPHPEILEKLCTFTLTNKDIIKVLKIMHNEFTLLELFGIFSEKDHIFMIKELLAVLKDEELNFVRAIYKNL